MKNTALLAAITLLISSLSAEVRTITIDRKPGTVAMFDNLADAYSDANDGDTLLFAPSSTGYGSVLCYKQLTFLGSGYRLDDNAVPGLNSNSVNVDITFKNDAGTGNSSGSVVRGMTGSITVDANVVDIIIDKCYNINHNWNINGAATISRCYHVNSLILNGSDSTVFNCILSALELNAVDTTATNCIITSRINTVPLSSVSNTIFTFSNGSNFDGDGSFTHCLSIGGTYLPGGLNNINGQIYDDVFVPSGSFDAKYQLKSEGPAEGAGLGDVDMGIYGGTTPYVLSGVPGIPRLTRFAVPATATNTSGLTFEVEAEAFPE